MKVFDQLTASRAAVALESSLPALADELGWRLSYAQGLEAHYTRAGNHVGSAKFAKIGTVLADLRHAVAGIAG
jgi:hypothetical protein